MFNCIRGLIAKLLIWKMNKDIEKDHKKLVKSITIYKKRYGQRIGRDNEE